MGTGRGGVGLGGQSSTTSIAPQQQQQQQQRSLHFEAQQTPVMDEFLEDMFAMPWDYNAGQGAMVMERAGTGAAMAGVEAASNINHNSNIGGSSSMAAAAQQQQKMFSMPLIQQQPRLLSNNNNGSGALSGVDQAQLVSSQASQLSSQQQQQGKEMRSEVCGMEGVSVAAQEPGSGSSTGLQMSNAAGLQQQQGGSLTGSASVGSSGSEDSGGQLGRGDHSPPPPTALTWQQQQQSPYVGAVPPPLSMSLAQAKVENILGRGEFNPHNAQMLGKRFREDEEGLLHENHSGITGSGPTSAPSGQGFPGSSQQGLPTVGVRPRVRARRGQATDPHSIAERLRRERIAERMKALQELVPNSNKTDKASMLDEIIDYVKFLQLQVKILSMSRLGGAGAVASTASDHPAEGSNTAAATISRSLGTPTPVQDGIALTERQVTRMMEDDMGSAMQYLQSKGLCLMPIALATAISTTNSRGSHTATVGAGDRQKTTTAGSNGGLATDGLVSEHSLKDNNREVESTNGTTTSMAIAKAPKGEGKPSDGP
ncbi:hypothetical protein CY35_02G174800 [Sphagnum magellanicum]|nr:hypothetical protein CY35_02G174800 [Sphagnum magellanicum]